jgi:hypothetical protein
MNVSVSDRRFKGRTSPRSCSGVHRLEGCEDCRMEALLQVVEALDR